MSYIKVNSKRHEKYKSSRNLIQLVTISNIFALDVVQYCQHYQLCQKTFLLENLQQSFNMLEIVKTSYIDKD